MQDPDLDVDDEPDAQDLAETFDETHLTDDDDHDDVNLDHVEDVLNSTAAEGDADDDEALDEADFDLEAIDDDAVEDDELDDQPDLFQPEDPGVEDDEDEAAAVEERLSDSDVEGLDQVGDADLVEGGEDDVTDFQSRNLSDQQIAELGYATDATPAQIAVASAQGRSPRARPRSARPPCGSEPRPRDRGDIPASDPVSISPGAD